MIAGLGSGLLAASIVTPLTRSLLFGISPTHAPTLAAAGVLMCAVAMLAGYLPARRAISTSPIAALRCE